MRKAFGILGAIAIMLLLAGLLVITIKYMKIGVKATSEGYLREQTELFMLSSIEKALLDISDWNRSEHSNECWSEGSYSYDDGKGQEYSTYIKVERYFLNDPSECNGSDKYDITKIDTSESEGFVIFLVESNLSENGTTKIRLINRSLQRP